MRKKLLSFFKTEKIDALILFIFVAISFLIRFVPIYRGDFPFLFDQGRDMIAVSEIVVNHHFTLLGPFTGLQGVFQGPLHYYLLAIPFILTSGDPRASVYMFGILYLVGIVLAYYLGRDMVDRRFGLLISMFVAIAPASIGASSYAWNPNWIPFLMIIYIYCLYKSIFKNLHFFPYATFIAGVVAQFELPFGIILFIASIVSSLLLNRKILLSKYIFFAFLSFGLTFTAQFLFDIRHQFQMTKALIVVAKGGEGGLGGIVPMDIRFPIRFNELLNASVFSISGIKSIAWIFVIFSFIGIALRFLKKDKNSFSKILFFLIIPLTVFACYFFYQRTAWSWYWVGVPFAYYFFLSFCLSQFFYEKRTSILLSVLLVIFFIFTAKNYGIQDQWEGDTGTFKHMLHVVDTVYQDANGKQFGEFVYTPPIYDYAYQHLFWWRGSTKYHYLPNKSKDGIFYLIIEPDKERPWAPNGWKETVIKTGKTEWIKHMPGDIELEKRSGTPETSKS